MSDWVLNHQESHDAAVADVLQWHGDKIREMEAEIDRIKLALLSITSRVEA